MGCSNSKLDREEVVLFCRERRGYIKKAVEQRYEFAAAHFAYIQALRNVGIALRNVVEGEEMTPPACSSTTSVFTPLGHGGTETETSSSLPQKSESPTPTEIHDSNSPIHSVHLLRSGRAPPVYFEERPPSPEIMRANSYSTHHNFGMDNFLNNHLDAMPSSHDAAQFGNPEYFPNAPESEPWDFFNPFTPLDNQFLYQVRRLSQAFDEDEFREIRRVRQEEGIPELEEDSLHKKGKEPQKEEVRDEEKKENQASVSDERGKSVEMPAPAEPAKEETEASSSEVAVEESNADALTKTPTEPKVEIAEEVKSEVSINEEPATVAEESNGAVEEECREEENHKDSEVVMLKSVITSQPRNVSQIMRHIEEQFLRAYQAGSDVSALLEVSKVQHSSGLSELKENPAKVLSSIMRSSSSRSSSFRTQFASSSSVDILDDSSSDFTEECGMLSGSHSSTLDRLYAWEKKLYEEVKSGERLRILYEKKCALLKSQESKGEDPFVIDKTRVVTRDIHTQIKVSIQTVESISKKIQKLREEELQPQLEELIFGLMQMWNMISQCHLFQLQIISEEAKLLSSFISTDPNPKLTLHLEHELHNWHASFNALFYSQRAYVQSLNGWLSKCVTPEPGTSSKGRIPFSPRRVGAPLIFSICKEWCRVLDQMPEKDVIHAIRNFAHDIHILWQKQDEEQRQKRRVDQLEKDLTRKDDNLNKVESKRHERNFTVEGAPDPIIEQRKMSIESFRKTVEVEKEKHNMVLKETQKTVLNILQNGLKSTLEALTQFAAHSHRMYHDLHEVGHKRT